MNTILSILNPREWILAAITLVVVVAGGYLIEQRIEQRGYDRAVLAYEKQAKKADDKREAIAAPITAAAEKEVIRIVTVTKTIKKEIPVYVKATDCPMSGGFRVLHDAAANGEVPDPARIPDAAPASAQDVADAVTDNYGTCQLIRSQLIHLQDWVRAQQDLK